MSPDTDNHFRFSPSILSRLGEELVTEPHLGLIELVKNAYDADATYCKISLTKDPTGVQQITVSDDGHGMEVSDIIGGWLLLGSSRKNATSLSPQGRKQVGDKGLGRLAALRLGRSVTLQTSPRIDDSETHVVNIDWSKFDEVDAVESVPLSISSHPNDLGHGTTIVIRNVQNELTERDVTSLARSLILFANPFQLESEFRPILEAPSYERLEKMVSTGYFQEAEYHLAAELDSSGRATATVSDGNGRQIWSSGADQVFTDQRYLAPECKFEAWIFLLDAKSFAGRAVSISEVRPWLANFGGFHVYRSGVRVAPYGSPGDDWLGVNLARARSPEDRPSINTSIGILITDDPETILREKTDRSGFIETPEFLEIRRFCVSSLEWLASKRIEVSEQRRAKTRAELKKSESRQERQTQAVLTAVATGDSVKAKQALAAVTRTHGRERELLQRDINLYRTMATVGTLVGVFAHETSKPIDKIIQSLESARNRIRALFADNADERLSDRISLAEKNAKWIKTFSGIPMSLVSSRRRRSSVADVDEVVRWSLNIFSDWLAELKIEVIFTAGDGSKKIHARPSILESILANFVTNSMKAIANSGSTLSDRKIIVSTSIDSTDCVISFSDTGPGIKGISESAIWLPGRTTYDDGVGFGLTIVKDSAIDLGGSVSLSKDGPYRGPEFLVRIPLLND